MQLVLRREYGRTYLPTHLLLTYSLMCYSMTASRSVPLLALSPYKRPLKQLGPSSHMVTLAPPPPPPPAPALTLALTLALALAVTQTLALALALALTLTRSCSRPGDLLRGRRAIAASSAVAVAAAAAAAAAVAAATVECVARRRRAEPHAPHPSCRLQRWRRWRQQQRRQATARVAASVTNRTCSLGSARLRVVRSCGRVEPPQAGVVRARSVARASQTQGPTDRGWPQKVGRGPQTVPTIRPPDTLPVQQFILVSPSPDGEETKSRRSKW
jgi:hypothetical protein